MPKNKTLKRFALISGLAILPLALVACDKEGKIMAPGPTETATVKASETSDPEWEKIREEPDVRTALDDLAEAQGADVADIAILERNSVMWSSGAIGCPEPGEAYTMALVSGEQLILELDSTRYDYHREGDNEFFYCANPEPHRQDLLRPVSSTNLMK